MKLKEILEILYSDDTEFKLYDTRNRIGIFRKIDLGVKEYQDREIEYIEPDDNNHISITVEE